MAQVAPITGVTPIVQETKQMTPRFRKWVTDITNLQIAESTDSPEGVLSAKASKLYRDTSATNPGTDLYIKRFDQVNGDTTLGWELVSGLSGTGDKTVVTAIDYQVLLGNININCTDSITVTAIAFADALDDLTITATNGAVTFAADATIDGSSIIGNGTSATWYPAGSQWWRK